MVKCLLKYGFVFIFTNKMLNQLNQCVDKEIEDKMWKNFEGLWQCSDCEYKSSKTTNVRNHIEAQHMACQGYY